MPKMKSHCLVVAAALAFSHAQRFDDLSFSTNWPNISDSCAEALNTTVRNCPAFLSLVSVHTPRLAHDQLTALCTKDCKSSLTTVRSTIAAGCGASDNMEWEGIRWPATLVIDRFRYTYDLSCRVDSKTGEYCDEIFFSWLNQSSFTSAQNCSDCALGTAQVQLNSPFEYEDLAADEFRSLTSSCGASGYAFTSPAPYAVSPASVSSAPASTASPICLRPYQVKAGDTCDQIATDRQVSTYGVISAGGLDPACGTLRAGSTLCLPDACSLYRVLATDKCTGIASAQGIDGQSLLAWNPNINSLCGSLEALVGSQICVSAPGGPLDQVSLTAPLAVSTATTTVPKPTNAPAKSKSRCGTWYTVQDGDFCDKISVQRSIALDDFYFLNPGIDAECTNLLLGLAYCVAPVGDISTYSGYPSSTAAMTLTSASFSTTSVSVPPLDFAPVTSKAPLPLASGSDANCDYYVEPIAVPAITDQSTSPDYFAIDASINSCGFIAANWGVSVAEFLGWNPSLSAVSPCKLQEDLRYCALRNASAIESFTTAPVSCDPVDDAHPDTIDSCSCFRLIEGDLKDAIFCEGLAEDSCVTVAKFVSWNPWLGTDCDSALFDGLGQDESRAVCIGVNSTAPTKTATDPPVPVSATRSALVGPTQTGIVRGCRKYYTVDTGDTCASVYGQAGITFDQLFAWNPAVGPDCGNLWLGYAYCIAGPRTTTTTSPAAPSSVTAPIQSGTSSDCSKYYTVVSGDSCAKIQDLFSVDFATLYRWNPSIGPDCQNLWLDYGVCVAGGPAA